MFPVERAGVLSDLAYEIQGNNVGRSEGTIFKLFNEEAVKKLADTTWNRMWDRFMTFGTASAGILAIIIILRVFKIVVDIIVRGYTLHQALGWGLHLLGAVWSSVAHCILYSAHGLSETTPEPKPRRRVDVEQPERASYRREPVNSRGEQLRPGQNPDSADVMIPLQEVKVTGYALNLRS